MRATIAALAADLASDVRSVAADIMSDLRSTAADLCADIVSEAKLIVWHWQLRRRVRLELEQIERRAK